MRKNGKTGRWREEKRERKRERLKWELLEQK